MYTCVDERSFPCEGVGLLMRKGGTPSPFFVPGRANPPGMGVGGLPVNPLPMAREFRGLLTFGSLVTPFAPSGALHVHMPGMGALTTSGGRGLPVNPPASRILNRPNPPTRGQGG